MIDFPSTGPEAVPVAAIAAMKEYFYKGRYAVQHAEPDLQDASLPTRTPIEGRQPGDSSVATPQLCIDGDCTVRELTIEPQAESEDEAPVVDQKHFGNEPSAMLFHLDVYGLAGYVQSQGLQHLATRNFEADARQHWRQRDFAAAVEKVYDVAPEGREGNHLRMIAVAISVEHFIELCDANDNFVDTLSTTPCFAAEVAMAIAGVHRGLKENMQFATNIFFCTYCSLLGEVRASTAFPNSRCPMCENTNRIELRNKFSGLRVPFSCKNRPCKFAFTTSLRNDLSDLICPQCSWTASSSAWEQ